MNLTYIMSKARTSFQKAGIKRFWAQEAKMSLTANNSLESARRKFFMNSTYIMSRNYLEIRNQAFLAQEGEMIPTPISSLDQRERKYFHELDVHHVQKAGIKRFWAQEAKMSLTANNSLESARRKFFMNSTYIMSRM